jgi:aldehyde dehydrogenase (NAD+)
MREYLKFYIDSRWMDPTALRILEVENPATERVCGTIAISRMDEAVASRAQFDKIQRLIRAGIDEGAEVVAGGLGRPDGLEVGYYVRPTVSANVGNDMTIAREEIFGPVLCILGYRDLDDAVATGNDTDYGLYGYVSGADAGQARTVARRIRAGTVAINHAPDLSAPFGGYRQSGNGREWGGFGFLEYLETEGIVGYETQDPDD